MANDACTSARRAFSPLPLGKFSGNGFARIIRSIESIVQVSAYFCTLCQCFSVFLFFCFSFFILFIRSPEMFKTECSLCAAWRYGVQNDTLRDSTENAANV